MQGEKKSCIPKYKSTRFGTQSKITKQQKMKSETDQQLYSRMSEIIGTAQQNITIVGTNTLHIFMKVEKNYKRKNGRLKRNF